MKFNKSDINAVLETITAPGEGKSLIESNSIKNIVIFGEEVIIDVEIGNPTIQAKKKVEVSILNISEGKGQSVDAVFEKLLS